MSLNKEIQIKRLSIKDVESFKELILLFKQVFEMETEISIDEPYLQNLLQNNNDFMVYAAVCDNKIVAGLTAYVMPMYYKQGAEAYIYDIGVKHDFQRQGIGKLLMDALQTHCKEHSIQLIFVEAHAEDTHAIDFYCTLGGNAEQVVHFNFEL